MTPPSHAATTDLDGSGVRLFGQPLLWVILAVLMVGASAFAWMTPATADAPVVRPYTVSYAFDYATPLPANAVYDAPALGFGDTVFLSVVDAIEVTVGFEPVRDDAVIDAGELVVEVVATSSAGWRRVLSTSTPVPLVDRQAEGAVTVDFAQALALATEIRDTTGTVGDLQVAVVAAVLVDGHLPGGGNRTVLDARTDASLAFLVTANTASPITPPSDDKGSRGALTGLAAGTAGASTETGEASQETGRASRDTGGPAVAPAVSDTAGVRQVTQMVPTDVARPNTVTMAFVTLDVSVLRSITTSLAVLFTLAAAASLILLTRAQQRGEVAYIAARYGARLVPMVQMPDVRDRTAVELSSFGALRSVSVELEQLIMFSRDGEQVDYYVADGATTYRYRTTTTTPVHRGLLGTADPAPA